MKITVGNHQSWHSNLQEGGYLLNSAVFKSAAAAWECKNGSFQSLVCYLLLFPRMFALQFSTY